MNFEDKYSEILDKFKDSEVLIFNWAGKSILKVLGSIGQRHTNREYQKMSLKDMFKLLILDVQLEDVFGYMSKLYKSAPFIMYYYSIAEIDRIYDNARLGGLLLGLLIHCNFKYKKSVSLMGFGRGCLVVQNCLRRLSSNNCGDTIMNVALVHGMWSIDPYDYTDSLEFVQNISCI